MLIISKTISKMLQVFFERVRFYLMAYVMIFGETPQNYSHF